MQYYRALIFYGKALRQAIFGVFSGKGFAFPLWDMAIGEGDDVFLTLGYYVIGDPVTLFSVFVPTSYMFVFYAFTVILKLYMAGLFFVFLFAETSGALEERKRISLELSVALGAAVYIFSYWGLLNSVRHPFFLNPLVYFPLVICGVEKILKGKNGKLLSIAVMLSAISNYYFFAMIVMLTVIYTAVRLLIVYKTDIKSIIGIVSKTALWSVLGVLMAAVILIPSYASLLTSSRIGGENIRVLLYPWEYYRRLPGLFLSTAGGVDIYWMCMGFTGISLISFILLFRKKGNLTLKVFAVISLVFVLFPIFGQAFNGMAYMANRWSFALALLVAYVTGVMLDEILDMSKKDIIFVLGFILLYLLLAIVLPESRTPAVFVSLGLAGLMMLLIFSKKKTPIIMAAVLVIGIICNFFFMNSDLGDDYYSEIKTSDEAKKYLNINETEAIRITAEENGVSDFYRYECNSPTLNAGFSQGISSTQHYWTSGISSVSDYRMELAVAQGNSYNYRDYDKKAIPMALTSVKYYVSDNENDKIPFGYEKINSVPVKEMNNEAVYSVYESKNALSASYGYDKYILKSEWNNLNMAQKQEAMLNAIVIDDKEDVDTTIDARMTEKNVSCAKLEPELSSFNVDYTVSHPEKVTVNSDNSFKVEGKEKFVTLELDKPKLAEVSDDIEYEVYVYAKGMNYVPKDAYKYYQKQSGGVNMLFTAGDYDIGSIRYLSNNNSHYDGKTNFMEKVYGGNGVPENIRIDFSHVGYYSFDELSVYVQPMNMLEDKVLKLNEQELENISFGTNIVSGTTSFEGDEILCLSVPYSKGWTAYIDGVKTNVFKANIKNMAVFVTAGNHEIIFRYVTPYLKISMLISVLATLMFIGICVYDYKKIHK